MSTSSPTAMSPLSEISRGQHEQAILWIDIARFTARLRGVVGALGFGANVHSRHIAALAQSP